MAGIELTFGNITQLVAALSPILLGFFMLMLSFMNQNVKGLIWFAGALLAALINYPIKEMVKSEPDPRASATCSMISVPFLEQYNSPGDSSLYLMFTFAYLFLPMRYNNQMNYGVIVALLTLFIIDGAYKVNNFCTTTGGVVLGGLVGFVLGAIWYTIFHVMGADNLLYFDEMDSNAVRCERPSKQTFKCKMYKNGQLVSEHIA